METSFESTLEKLHLMITKTLVTNYCQMEGKDPKLALAQEIKTLKDELQDRERALPAHTIRPHQLQAIEELEEKMRLLEEKFRKLYP
jgi:hypothetical protein